MSTKFQCCVTFAHQREVTTTNYESSISLPEAHKHWNHTIINFKLTQERTMSCAQQ